MTYVRHNRVGRCGASVDGPRRPCPGGRRREEGRAAGRGAFTITELLLTIIVLFLLITLLVVAVNRATAIAVTNAERQTVASMRIGVEQFQSEFGFLPPLVKDNPDPTKYSDWNAPLSGDAPLDMEGEPVVFSIGDEDDLEFLRGGEIDDVEDKDYRFSEYSLPYYLMGVLGEDQDGELIDGVGGPGFRTPSRDGTFAETGRSFEPFFLPNSATGSVVAVDTQAGRYELRDGKAVAYRYYRWEPGDPDDGELTDLPEDYNVPDLIGDGIDDVAVRGARWAIVAAGQNGVFGDWTEGGTGSAEDFWESKLGRASNEATLLRRAREDNIVEVGR